MLGSAALGSALFVHPSEPSAGIRPLGQGQGQIAIGLRVLGLHPQHVLEGEDARSSTPAWAKRLPKIRSTAALSDSNSARLLKNLDRQIGILLLEEIIGAVQEEGGRSAVLGAVLHVDGKSLLARHGADLPR